MGGRELYRTSSRATLYIAYISRTGLQSREYEGLYSQHLDIPEGIESRRAACRATDDPKSQVMRRGKHTIRLLPSTASTETETNPRGPGPPLEQQNREDDTEGQTEGRLDNHGGDGAVPLSNCTVSPCLRILPRS